MRRVKLLQCFCSKNSPKFILEDGMYLSRNVKTFLNEHGENLKKIEEDINKKIHKKNNNEIVLSDLSKTHKSFLKEFNIQP